MREEPSIVETRPASAKAPPASAKAPPRRRRRRWAPQWKAKARSIASIRARLPNARATAAAARKMACTHRCCVFLLLQRAASRMPMASRAYPRYTDKNTGCASAELQYRGKTASVLNKNRRMALRLCASFEPFWWQNKKITAMQARPAKLRRPWPLKLETRPAPYNASSAAKQSGVKSSLEAPLGNRKRPCGAAAKMPPSRNRDIPKNAVTTPKSRSTAQPGKCRRRLFASNNAASSATLSLAKAKRWAALPNRLRMGGR